MSRRQSGYGGAARGWTVRILSCAVLTGLGLTLILGARKALEYRQPFVDISRRISAEREHGPANGGSRLRFAVATMVSAEATFSTYRKLVRRISRDVGRQAEFVMRPSYAKVRWNLESGDLDVAFVCTGTYVHALHQKRIKLLVQPEFAEGRQYRCLFLVPAGSSVRKIEDLHGKVMAFTDPESNTGCLVPSATLQAMGHDPKSFFKRIIFTRSHDRSILSVAAGVVDCAAVDSLVWESVASQEPDLAGRVRVIWQSEPFGPPPIVVPKGLPKGLEASLRDAFLNLHEDQEGREILSAIGIRRFTPAKPESYQTAVDLYQRLQQRGGLSWP
ncbi:MAG: substrate-binding domain-containing protein [Planctomycetota bacterium]|jgi:phosphonate transport system substrate-binding protein